MGSSKPEPQEIKLEAPEQKIFQSFVPPEDFEYLNDLVKKYEGRSKELDKYLGATRQIDKEREARTAASYFSSLPSKELDYTSGLGQSINALNNIDYFRQDLKPGKQKVNRFAGERQADQYKPVKEKETAPAVRDIAAQFANRRADEAKFTRPEETAQFVTPEIVASETTDETTPDPYTEGKWGSQWGGGSYSTEELRKRFGLAYDKGLERRAEKRKGVGTTGLYNEKGDIWGKSSAGEDVYLGRIDNDNLYENKELLAGHSRQADPREQKHSETDKRLSSIGDRAGAIWNLWDYTA